jgi:hypothetical protein
METSTASEATGKPEQHHRDLEVRFGRQHGAFVYLEGQIHIRSLTCDQEDRIYVKKKSNYIEQGSPDSWRSGAAATRCHYISLPFLLDLDSAVTCGHCRGAGRDRASGTDT